MVTVLTPHLDVLPLPQQRLWDELIDIPEDMVPYGGTAIALHLGTASRWISTSSPPHPLKQTN